MGDLEIRTNSNQTAAQNLAYISATLFVFKSWLIKLEVTPDHGDVTSVVAS